jgi:hypothetical protein
MRSITIMVILRCAIFFCAACTQTHRDHDATPVFTGNYF